MTADIIPLKTDRPDPREVLARRRSNTIRPSAKALLEAAGDIDALFDAGWEIVPRGDPK
jgi:hypothetical protein